MVSKMNTKSEGDGMMKKYFLLLTSLLVLVGAGPVLAQSTEITDLETEVNELSMTLKEKKEELKELKKAQEGVYIIETNNSTFAFSNPRVHENLLLLDLDYTNDSKVALDVMSDIWMLTFNYEDDKSINQLWFENFDLPEVEDRSPLSYNSRIKSGVTVKLVIGLSNTSINYPYYSESEEMLTGDDIEENTEDTEEMLDTDWLKEISTLFITVDSYTSPTGLSERIEIPLP